MWSKIRSVSQKICDALEWVLAVIVFIGIAAAIIRFVPNILIFASKNTTPHDFLTYLEDVFTIVVGVEFLKMLCKPSSDNVIEVLIFLVTRHMIIGDTSSFEDLLSIVGIALLFVVRRHLRKAKEQSQTHTRQT